MPPTPPECVYKALDGLYSERERKIIAQAVWDALLAEGEIRSRGNLSGEPFRGEAWLCYPADTWGTEPVLVLPLTASVARAASTGEDT